MKNVWSPSMILEEELEKSRIHVDTEMLKAVALRHIKSLLTCWDPIKLELDRPRYDKLRGEMWQDPTIANMNRETRSRYRIIVDKLYDVMMTERARIISGEFTVQEI